MCVCVCAHRQAEKISTDTCTCVYKRIYVLNQYFIEQMVFKTLGLNEISKKDCIMIENRRWLRIKFGSTLACRDLTEKE